MEFRSIFRHPPGPTIPLLPLHNKLLSPTSSVSLQSSSPPVSPYRTAPQSPDIHPTAPPTSRDSLAYIPTFAMSTLIPRPPILQSDSQIALHRQHNYLESHLQTLLDAQSEGLLAGLAGGAPPLSPYDDRSSSTAGRSKSRSTTGSATPTSTTRNGRITWAPPGEDGEEAVGARQRGVVLPVRQPQPKKIGLRSARRGISRTMAELSVLKTRQAQAVEVEISRRDEVLLSASRIADKQAGLQAQIQKIEFESASQQRLKGMQNEAERLDADIKELEGRLYEMKARQRVLRQEMQRLENGVQARLSSYRSALGMAEMEARAFVVRPPLPLSSDVEQGSGAKMGVWALPKERRTVEMVKEHYEEEEKALRGQIEGLEKERDALEEGGEVWGEVVEAVMGVEEALRSEMKSMTEETKEASMRKLTMRMGKTVRRIQEKLVVAEEKGWNLLVAAIGAEAEALGEGHRVLEGTLRQAVGEEEQQLQQQSKNVFEDDIGGERDDHRPKRDTGDHGLEELANGGQNLNATDGSSIDRFEEENDGPGPDLLIEDHE